MKQINKQELASILLMALKAKKQNAHIVLFGDNNFAEIEAKQLRDNATTKQQEINMLYNDFINDCLPDVDVLMQFISKHKEILCEGIVGHYLQNIIKDQTINNKQNCCETSCFNETSDFNKLINKTILNISINEDKTEVIIETENEFFKLFHNRDCCESVWLEDITEDYENILINQKILVAEEITNRDIDEDKKFGNNDSETWTFYKLATQKGYVDMRWVGSSNGYYSEAVECVIIPKI